MTCTCAGTAPGYPQHESYCGKPDPDEDDGCAGCRVIGPLLTAPGTSGRTWVCECGKVWEPAD
jgi:hypothetical protein